VHWLVHQRFKGMSAAKSCLAQARFAPMLSSQKMRARPGMGLDFIHHFVDGPITHPALIHLRDGAIVAGERAAARGDGDAFAIGAALDELPARGGHLGEVRQRAGFVNGLEFAALEVCQQLGPNQFAFADNDGVGVLSHFPQAARWHGVRR